MLAAVICVFLRGRHARNCTIACQGTVSLLNCSTLIYMAVSGKDYVVYRLGPEHASLAAVNQLRFSQLECLIALVFSLIVLLSAVGGYRYVKQDIDDDKQNLYNILINLLGTALMALTYTNDLFTGYVFLEILTLTSCGILMIRELGRTTVAAVRYMIINLLGSGLFLMGVIVLYGQTGNLLMENIREVLDGMEATPLPVYTATALICAGLAVKSGMFPFHFWMPDTYGFATPTSASLLSGVVSKGYIVLLFKILIRVLGTENRAVHRIGWLLLILGLCGMIFGSVSALRQNKLNKMLAFSSAAQIGYIYTGIGIGCVCGVGTGAVFGFTAAIYHVLAHALTKPLLFLTSARLIEVSDNSGVFRKLRGAGSRAGAAAFGFTVGALSMVGVPLFAGFVSKLLFSVAAIRSQNLFILLAVLSALAVSTLLNALYFLRTVMTLYVSNKPQAFSSVCSVAEQPETAGQPQIVRQIGAAMQLGTAVQVSDGNPIESSGQIGIDGGSGASQAAGPDKKPQTSLRTEKSLVFSSVVFTALNILLGCGSSAVVGIIVTVLEKGLMG